MMGSEQYCLKWNNHWANLIRVFNSLLQSETFVDVTLACEGRHLKAHRLVLSACSPYFKDLLVAHPDRHPIVILKDVRYSELRTLIEFIYNGEVSVEQQDLAALLCTARELQIKGLADSLGAPPPHPPPPYSSHEKKSSATNNHSSATTSLPVHHISSASGGATVVLPPVTTSSSGLVGVIGGHNSPRSTATSEDSIRPPPPLTAIPAGLLVSQVPPPPHTATREGTPPYKRLRLSIGDPPPNALVNNVSSANGHLEHIENAWPPGLRIADNIKKEDCSSNDGSSSAPVNTNGVMAATITPVATATLKAPEEESDEPASLTIRSPEVILEERPPSLSGSAALGGLASSAMSGALPPGSGLSTQVALLQRAMALGYPPIPYGFPPGLLEQHPVGHQGANSKDIMELLMKLPGSGLPLSMVPGVAGHLSLPSSGTPPTTNAVGNKVISGGGVTCHICAMILPSPRHLEEHVRIHEEEKPYKCDQCGQRYKYQSAFQRHQEQNHTAKLPGDKPYRCDVCGQCFKYHKSFAKHRSNHDVLDRIMQSDTQHPGRLIPSESYLQSLLRQSESSNNESEASITLKEEQEPPDEMEEARRASTSSTPTTTTTSFNAVLLGAITSQNGDKKVEEGEEGEIAEDQEGDDMGDDDDEENCGKFVYCVKCKSTFRDVSSFEGHCRGSSECSLDTLREVSVGGDGAGSVTPASGASSPQASPRLSPSRSSGTPRSPLPASTPTALPSPPAHATTPTGGLPPSSIIGGLPPGTTTSGMLPGTSTPPGGLVVSPSGGPPSLMLPSAHSLTSNQQGGEEERPFKCPYCQKGFKGRENLKLHIRTHTGEKPYNCGVCGKAFGGRSDMNRHLRIHTGEKPYPCKVCGKKFARADYLSKHITTHLGIPFAKPVHSLHQSLQNLENMQNLQNLHKLQNISKE